MKRFAVAALAGVVIVGLLGLGIWPAAALDQGLRAITEQYGDGTANVVATQLEYPRST